MVCSSSIDRGPVTLCSSARHGICSFCICPNDARPFVDTTVGPGFRGPMLAQADKNKRPSLTAWFQRSGSSGLIPPIKVNKLIDGPVAPHLAPFLIHRLNDERTEKMLVLFFDNGGRMVGEVTAGSAHRSQCAIGPSLLVQKAHRLAANKLVLAHNHPSGIPSPSQADVHATSELDQLVKPVGVRVVDHFIVASGQVFSMRKARLVS